MIDETGRHKTRETWEIIRNQSGLSKDMKPADIYVWYHGRIAREELRAYKGRIMPWRWDEMHSDLTNLGMSDDEAEHLVVRTLGMRLEKVVRENVSSAVDANRQSDYLAGAKGANNER